MLLLATEMKEIGLNTFESRNLPLLVDKLLNQDRGPVRGRQRPSLIQSSLLIECKYLFNNLYLYYRKLKVYSVNIAI